MKYTGITLYFCLAGLIVSCTKKTEQPQAQTDPAKECYQHIANKDTVTIFLNFANNRVDGTLFYNLYEKDKSKGTLEGEMKGDTLIARYTFLSEGSTSTSDVVFLKRDSKLIQGFGETTTVDGKQIFKNRRILDFNDSLVLTAIECEKK